jgi:hypothetical protein
LSRDRGASSQKQIIATFAHPIVQLVGAGGDFIRYFVDAEHATALAVLDQPVPQGGAEVQPIVQVLGLDEDVGIEQVAAQAEAASASRGSLGCFIVSKPETVSSLRRVFPSRGGQQIVRPTRDSTIHV